MRSHIPTGKLSIEVSDFVEIDNEPPRLCIEHSIDGIAMVRLVGARDGGYRVIKIFLKDAHSIEEDGIYGYQAAAKDRSKLVNEP